MSVYVDMMCEVIYVGQRIKPEGNKKEFSQEKTAFIHFDCTSGIQTA